MGIALASVGLLLLGVTAGEAEPSGAQSSYRVAAAALFETGLVAAGVALLSVPRVRTRTPEASSGMLLGAGAGLLFTVSHIGIKALTHGITASSAAWVPLVVAAFAGAFFASARSLQIADAVPVIAITGATSNVSAIIGGIVVFNDPVGANALVVALRIAAFGLVVLAAALIPAPVRAAEPGEAGAPA
jgi:hypothetical protein